MKTMARTVSAIVLFALVLAGPALAVTTNLYFISVGANWDNAANWDTSSGGPGPAPRAPGANDIAIFDNNSTNCTIDAAVNVFGIVMTNAYAGVIAQQLACAIAVGSNGWYQDCGTFAGGTNAITINGTFTLKGGGFTNTSGTLTVGRQITPGEIIFSITNGATFEHNNGTVEFRPKNGGSGLNYNWYTNLINTPAGFTLNNVIVNAQPGGAGGGYSLALSNSSGNSIAVIGNFTHADGILQVSFEVQGNVTIGTGPDGGTGTLTLNGSTNQTLAWTGGTPSSGTWTIDKSGGTLTLASDISLSGATQDLIWTNAVFNLLSNTLTAGRNLNIYTGATTLGVTVADATRAGGFKVGNTASGISNLDVVVTVDTVPAIVAWQNYTIVSNNAVLGEVFKSVTWLEDSDGIWRGTVSYTNNGRTTVTFSKIHVVMPGTIVGVY